MTSPERLVAVALGEVGYLEKASPKQPDLFEKKANPGTGNFTKYAFDLFPSLQGQSWCAMCVSWCADRAGAVAAGIIPLYYSCTDGYEWFRSRGGWHFRQGYTPVPGDVCIFGQSSPEHTGIVAFVADDRVYIVEGNKGNAVQFNSYALDYVKIFGYGHPAWESVPECMVTLPVLRKGDKTEPVRTLQRLLIAQGFSCGSKGTDGSFGGATLAAVKTYQSSHGLTADGVVAEETWKSLLCVD